MKKIGVVFILLVISTFCIGLIKFGLRDGIKINAMAYLCAIEDRSHNNLIPSGLPVYDIEIADESWAELISDLPQSGDDKKSIIFKHEGKDYDAKVKIRGHLKLHWGGRKKSIRVYFKDDSPFGSIDKMNFLNPKTYQLTNDHIGTWVGKTVGTKTMRNEMVFLRINGQNYGVMEMIEQPSKSFAVNRHESDKKVTMYKGDYIEGEDGNNTAVDLWKSAENWDSKKPPADAALKLASLVKLLNDDTMSLENRFKGIVEHVVIDEYIKYYAALALINTDHIDQQHNQIIIFDKSKQKYYPVLWDPTFMWSHEPNRFYKFCDPLSYYILQNPIWREKRDLYMYAYLNDYYDSGIFTSYHKDLEDILWVAVKQDPNKCNPVGSNLDWVYPFSSSIYRHSNEKIRSIADDYYQTMKQSLSSSSIEKLDIQDSILTITYQTYSPLILDIECSEDLSVTTIELKSKNGYVMERKGKFLKIKLYGQIEHEDGPKGSMYKLFSGFVPKQGEVEINIGVNIKNVNIYNALTKVKLTY